MGKKGTLTIPQHLRHELGLDGGTAVDLTPTGDGGLVIQKHRPTCNIGYTATEDDILKKLYYDIAAVQDVVGDETPLVITMSRPVAAIFDMSSTLSKSLSVMDFKQGDVTVKVKSLNGEHPILRVGSGRMKTSYQFYDGTTSGQEKGGFVAAEDAQDINWIICPRTAPIAVSRTDKVRIFDPETFQKKRAWATDYRKYHDLWIPDNKLTAMWVNIKQAKAGVGG